ncbi:MAG: hypothetical protein C3F13_18340 [Anaerolineales bacterium]|nr:MAG: hypothetical protein C3F13_18340 [Anaerolineales bacterium]
MLKNLKTYQHTKDRAGGRSQNSFRYSIRLQDLEWWWIGGMMSYKKINEITINHWQPRALVNKPLWYDNADLFTVSSYLEHTSHQKISLFIREIGT